MEATGRGTLPDRDFSSAELGLLLLYTKFSSLVLVLLVHKAMWGPPFFYFCICSAPRTPCCYSTYFFKVKPPAAACYSPGSPAASLLASALHPANESINGGCCISLHHCESLTDVVAAHQVLDIEHAAGANIFLLKTRGSIKSWLQRACVLGWTATLNDCCSLLALDAPGHAAHPSFFLNHHRPTSMNVPCCCVRFGAAFMSCP
ncbi:hypothetical protein LR48_Vigan10g028300 [Vigna angularis]|uniref:Uncharacterized protein n=1 Tax=Phaseolus angularis TaxID=3914 RepID=A0A0L9VH67_PHAAN|nr:hypothetical protein LR48_Vigan10g028300 [Vigna angularis]